MSIEFSLQTVLDYRHSRVEGLEIELGRLLFEQQQARRALEALEASRQSLFGELRQKQAGVLDLASLTQMRLNLRHLEKRLAQQQTALAELAQRIDEHRRRLITAKQDEETLVTLKNKEIAQQRAEQMRLENALRDDLYIMRAHQRAAS